MLEIRPEGRSLPPFRDYLAVHLTFRELRHLVEQPDAHRDWVAGLKAVGGIYLVVSTLTGEQDQSQLEAKAEVAVGMVPTRTQDSR